MQNIIRELPMFGTQIRDNPLELLYIVEKLAHVPMKAVYPTLAIIETLNSLIILKY